MCSHHSRPQTQQSEVSFAKGAEQQQHLDPFQSMKDMMYIVYKQL